MIRTTTKALVAAATAAVTLLGLGAAPAGAAVEPPRPAFYEAPATLPAGIGTLIRSEPMTYTLDPLNVSALRFTARRILYTSTDRTGAKIAVSGTVLVPTTPWIGLGRRPLVSVAPGTQGLADRCAPSRQQSEGLEYENLLFEGLLTRGYAIVMTDYQGLGTAGVHTYMNRVVQGHAVLDAARAAIRLPGSGLSSTTPVGITGYSQGGGAAAAAAELAASYAPDLRIKGASVGAVPADLSQVLSKIDGSLYAEFALYGVRGLAAGYGVDTSTVLNAAGQRAMDEVEGECVFDLAKHAFVSSTTLTKTGTGFAGLLGQQPWASIVNEQRIGRIKPSMPVLVDHSALDDVIPYAVGKQLAKDWCRKGANVRFSSNLAPLHVGGAASHAAESLAFFEARFAGLPQWSNCWTL